jgi:hypothetical protein
MARNHSHAVIAPRTNSAREKRIGSSAVLGPVIASVPTPRRYQRHPAYGEASSGIPVTRSGGIHPNPN